jgi:ribose 5-phosphate isomerase B
MTTISDADLKRIVDEVVTLITRENPQPVNAPAPLENKAVVSIGADHGGFDLKKFLISHLESKGYRVDDCGTYNKDSVDYPDYAKIVAEKVASGSAWRGIMIDGAGIGSCMAANKIKGVRAALCYDHATAFNSREHNNANYLTLGAGLIGSQLALSIVDTFLDTPFAGGRHERRVNKIMQIEENI